MTPQEINDLRQRVLRGETVPPEELAGAIAVLRSARNSAAQVSASSAKKKGKMTTEEADAQLKDLLGL